MAHTNSTENYGLPQWIGTDKPTFLGDFNTAFGTIDTQMKANSDAATTAVATANSADATATSANTNATTALNTANSAATDAASAVSTASTANSTANTAKTNADAALRASAANTIENLAPAYDPTLTYDVGDLVTYIDAQNSGKLYKCIVAVNTPMEFNVNYWDDVTTSEIYSRKALVENTVTADGVKTYNELLSEIKPDSVDTTVRYTIVISTATYDMVFTSTLLRSDLIAFASTRIGGGGVTIETLAISLTSDCEYKTALIATTPAVTINDLSDTAPASGVTITLYGEKMN